MNDLNVIKVMEIEGCPVYVCDNEIGTKEEQDKSWQEFSKIACRLVKEEEENGKKLEKL